MNLQDWLSNDQSIEQKQKLFYNMSKTMNYIHDRDYCVKSFNLKEIEILNLEKLSPIQYNTVVRIPENYKDDIVREDIYNLTFIQISAYTNFPLDRLNPIVLKEQFNEFEKILPENDINYLRGVIERGAGVYYYQYVNMNNEKEIERLSQEMDREGNVMGDTNSLGIQKTKSTSVGKAMVDKETKKLYSDLVDKQQAAFVSFLIFPLSLIILGVILGIIMLMYT